MSIETALQLAREHDVKYVDIMFGDMFGTLQHFTVPATRLDSDLFEEGLAFDGSSVRGWKSIDKSDMNIKPDPDSGFIDPFREQPTICFFGDIYEPRTGQRYDRDPRSIAYKALSYLNSSGLGDMAFFGPEPEFFIFDGIRYASDVSGAFYEIDSVEAPWTSGRDDGYNLGHKIRHKHGYFPTTPQDTLMDLRSEITTNMMTMGLEIELHHHEVATAGQCEIGTKFGTIITAADQVHKYKYAVKNTAFQHGKTATFMPKPMFGDNGSGMHCHLSIWKGGKNLFAGDQYAKLSQTALYAIGGVLKHGRSIQALTNPSANSYRRLVPGYEAPVNLAYSATNRSASVRIPHVNGDKARRFEFRCPDSSGSPYLAFAAILMAAIDGIKNEIDPGDPLDKNIYDLPPEELAGIPSTCKNLEEAIEELEADNDWLTAGDVFTPEMLEGYLDYKKSVEVEPLKLRPNPYEFYLYYDA
ncbi:MAG: type I glutamate--ammonia ligase [Planctomycetota bacterium]|nr:MAG: type I glutamate--ammonia ligase [Planctomycetota bacterium]